jgi:hypothetical protein
MNKRAPLRHSKKVYGIAAPLPLFHIIIIIIKNNI